MRSSKKTASLFFVMALSFALYGCSSETGSPLSHPGEVAIAASFQQENGIALEGSTVHISHGEGSAAQPLDDSGEAKISGLPRNGNLMLTVLDRQEEVQGAMTLSFSEGAVIDAATDESGVGHITLRRDTDEVALAFILREDGSIFCSLWLMQPSSSDFNMSQEN